MSEARRSDERAHAERYELLASVGRDIVLFVRAEDGRILDANAAALAAYGYERAELLALTVKDLRAPATSHLTERQMAQAAEDRGVMFETVHRRRDGTTFDVEVSSRGAAVDGTRTLVSIIRDVTERKRVEADLREANARLRDSARRKDEFLAVLSHELRNPLAPILNGVHLLERAPGDGEEARRAREVIRRQTEHLTRLVDDLLDVTRVARGKIELKRQRVDLREVVRKAMDDARALFERAAVALRVEHALGPAWIDADPVRIAQVIGNILHNAQKFTPVGGAVTVRLAAAAGRVELEIADTGVGMEPGQEGRMFEPFAQGDQGIARTRGGLGLGLALVKALVEMHGGTVAARSDGRGRGTTLSVSLPLAPAAAEAARAARAGRAVAGRRIVVIEDNEDAAETLAEVLALEGHVVRTARDGRSGIALVREVIPDVVICDIGLPDLSGYEVAQALRSDPTLTGTRLVALTGYAQPDDRHRAVGSGFDAHVAKPPELRVLLGLIAGERA